MRLVGPVLAVLGALAVAAGLFLGLASVERDGLICGRAFSSHDGGPRPDDAPAEDGIFYGGGNGPSECSAALSTRRAIALSTAIPGAVLVVVGVGLWLRTRPGD
jgi:hypothetical protein